MKINFPFNYQLRIYGGILEQREGVCSLHNTERNKHCLLWDFDDAMEGDIILELLRLQVKYTLPTIHVVSSSLNNYHAYCFCSRSLKEIIHILTDTIMIDMRYLRLGMVRGYYTLRITPRQNDSFQLVTTLRSFVPDEMDIQDVTVNRYLTSNTGHKGEENA